MQVRARVENRLEEFGEAGECRPTLALALVVPFLNEREHLPVFLKSIDAQSRRPDQLVLVDDGSSDGSYELARAFAQLRPYAVALRRPPRPPEADRLASAAELRAFQWGLEQVEIEYDIVAKLDADLELSPLHLAVIEAHFKRDPDLGVAGGYLSIRLPDGALVRERHPADHVRGPNKFYRRECLAQISPLPAHLGWDTIDEVKARMRGWRTTSVEIPGADSVHLRPTGMHDGRLRAYWRWGECAYGFGSHPLHIVAGTVTRFRERPYVASGAAYMLGWAAAHLRGRPRAGPEVRSFRRREELRRIKALRGRRSTRVSVSPQ